MDITDLRYEDLSDLEKAEFHIDRSHFPLAELLIKLAQAKALDSIASSLEVIAGKNGVIYTRDANSI